MHVEAYVFFSAAVEIAILNLRCSNNYHARNGVKVKFADEVSIVRVQWSQPSVLGV